MSRKEAISRLFASMATRAYSDEQLRMIRSARVVGVENCTDIEQAVTQIPSEQLSAQILEMVKSPKLLEDGSLANLASRLTHARADWSSISGLFRRNVGQLV